MMQRFKVAGFEVVTEIQVSLTHHLPIQNHIET